MKVLVRAGSVGIHLVSATFVGLAIGYYLDKWLGTRPWFIIIFLILGIITGFRDLVRMAMSPDNDKKENDAKKSL